MANFHRDEAIFFFEKKNSKWPTQKKVIFQNHQFSIFVYGLVLGLVELNDAKGIDLTQPIFASSL